LITHIRSHIADRVLGDPSRVRQILLNLVGNAIKFTEQGHVAVEMDARAEGEMAHVSIRVRDTGIGIPEDRIGSLFQAFIQIDGSTARKYGGTGLGLAISHKLAALMGGKLTCTSKVGDGTEFLLEVSLPIRERRAERRPWLPDTARGLRVLVVDDNDASLRLVHEMLASEQCVVWTATSAAKAVQMLRDAESPSSLPQLIICDYLMPGHDGFDFAAEVHKLKSCDNIPLVLITALKFQRWQDAAEHGFASVITKPVRRHEFWDTIREVMGYEARTWAGARRTAFVEQPVAQTPSTCDGGKLRVLLAEDNAVNQKLAVAILSKMNCDITTARDGVEAVRLHAELNPDLIFMDIQMPELDGMQASRRIRESEPPNRRVPIIAMTARAMKGDRDDCVAAGMDDYVSKPLRREEIDRVFAHWGNVAIANRQPV
jgi:CheY-like chemotaxis protein